MAHIFAGGRKMTFEKLDENTVRCILSEDDMIEHGLRVEDFFLNKDKARSFLEGVVKQAQDEVGYETTGDTLAMQVMPLPHNRLSITFSEKSDHALQSMLGHLRSAIDELAEEDVDVMMDQICQSAAETSEDIFKKEKKKKGEKKKSKAKKTFFRVYCFDTFSNLEQFCGSVSKEFNVKSQLYKDAVDEKYYLAIEKGRLSQKNLEKICYCATEFATLVSKQQSYIEYCREQYTCMIKKGAVKVLGSLA